MAAMAPMAGGQYAFPDDGLFARYLLPKALLMLLKVPLGLRILPTLMSALSQLLLWLAFRYLMAIDHRVGLVHCGSHHAKSHHSQQ